MPASLKLFLKILLDILSCILEVCNFVFGHLDVDVLRDLHGIVPVSYTHLTLPTICSV